MKITITRLLISPIFKISKEKLKENGYLNGYIKDEMAKKEYTSNCVFLLFKPSDYTSFRNFLEEEKTRTSYFVDDYDYPGGFVVLVYKIDEKYKNDIKLIKKGKYSQVSKDYQSLFSKEIETEENGIKMKTLSMQYRIFNKTEDLIKFWEEQFDEILPPEQEVWHGWEIEKETLNKHTLEEYK